MAFKTATVARWTILSSTTGTPIGLCRPSAFGRYTRRTGSARYAPRFSLADRSCRLPSRSCPYCCHVSSSTPAAASRLRSEVEVRLPKHLERRDVVQERRELYPAVPLCCLAYPLQS